MGPGLWATGAPGSPTTSSLRISFASAAATRISLSTLRSARLWMLTIYIYAQHTAVCFPLHSHSPACAS